MTFFTVLLIVVVILAVIGLGWSQFSIGVLTGLNKALDVGIPIIKNLTQEANAQQLQQQQQQQPTEDSVTMLAKNDTFLKETDQKARTLYWVLGGGEYYESKVNWSNPASVDEYRAIFDATMRMIKDEQTYDPGFEYNVPPDMELDPALTAYIRMLVVG